MRRTPIRTCSGSPNEAQSRTQTRCSRSSRRRTAAASPTSTSRKKTVRPARGRCALSDAPVTGYEIHTGRSAGADLARPVFRLETGADGARSADGLVEGTYVHGLFANDACRRAWLERIGDGTASFLRYEAAADAALDAVADTLSSAVDLDALSGPRARRTWLQAQLRERLRVQFQGEPATMSVDTGGELIHPPSASR